jgi:nucleotide-binding universal stress UspA family protein
MDGLTNAGRRAITAAARVLSHIGIEHRDRVEIGDTVETILRVANNEGCNLIIISSPSPGSLQKWIQGATGVWISTTAGRVAELATVPVVIVK